MTILPFDKSSEDPTLAAMLRVESKLDALMTAHNDMVILVNTFIATVEPYAIQAGPIIAQIENSPLLKMFGGKRNA